jgi:opacity protein-like surface antigen
MRLTRIVAAAGLIAFPGAALHAQSRTAIAIAAGPSFPMGKLADTQSKGMDLNLGFIRGSDDAPIGVRFDFGYDRMKGKTVNAVTQPEKRFTSGTINLLFSFAGHLMKPYVLGGVGAIRMATDQTGVKTSTRFGFDFGAGVTIPIVGRAAFIEGRINSMSQASAKPARYVPVVLGFLF